MWLLLLGATLLGVIALNLTREGTIQEPTEQSFDVANATQQSSFAKFKRGDEPAVSSHSSQRHADEIDAIDFSIANDRSRWVDPAWLR